jgi:hypothetical protein
MCKCGISCFPLTFLSEQELRTTALKFGAYLNIESLKRRSQSKSEGPDLKQAERGVHSLL